jgi:DNA polymerase II small subunit/DNA polymerase delta subunit B
VPLSALIIVLSSSVCVVLGSVKMFNSILREHRSQHASSVKKSEEIKSDCTSAANKLSNTLSSQLASEIGLVYRNQRRIENEAKKLQGNTLKFNKQLEQWQQQYNQYNNEIKQLGDINNFVNMIDQDLSALAVSLSTIIAIKQHEKAENTMKIQAKQGAKPQP